MPTVRTASPCGGSRGHGFTLDADVRGGANRVTIDIRHGDRRVEYINCFRSGRSPPHYF
ncbi:hypothetical protein GCM10028832_27180 [Streptomyces sparsus]